MRTATGALCIALWGCGPSTTPPQPLDAAPLFGPEQLPQIVSDDLAGRIDHLLALPISTCDPGVEPPELSQRLELAENAEKSGRYMEAAEVFGEISEGLAESGLGCQSVAAAISQGRSLRRGGDAETARSVYHEALQRAESLGDIVDVAKLLNNLGVLESSAGHLRLALDYHAAARALGRRLGESSVQAFAQLSAGEILFRYGLLEDAQRELEDAVDLLATMGDERRAPLAAALTWLGRVQFASGDVDAAQHSLDRALVLRREIGKPAGIAVTLDARGRILSDAGLLADAEEDFEMALALLPANSVSSRVNTRSNLAELRLRQGRPLDALRSSAGTLRQMAAHGFEDSALRSFLLFVQAQAHRDLSQLERAVSLMERSLEIDELRRLEDSGDLLMHFFAARRSRIEFQVDLLIESGRLAEAFDLQERSRARGLLDQVFWGPIEIRSHVSADLLEREREVRGEIEVAGRVLDQGLTGDTAVGETGEMEEAGSRLERAQLELLRLEAEMRSQAIGSRIDAPLDLTEAMELLDDDTLLLTYWLGSNRSVLTVIDRNRGMQVFDDLPDRGVLEMAAGRLRRVLASGSEQQAEIEALGLARVLLEPALPRLKNAKRLIVVPDGGLALIPFAFLRPRPDQPRLVQTHRVVLVPSMSVLSAIRGRALARRTRLATQLVVVADPIYSSTDERMPAELRRPSTRLDRWPRLHASATVAEAVSNLVPADQRRILLGAEASRAAILGGALEGARFVHFGVHAELHPSHPLLSFLVLSAFDPTGKEIPHKLRLGDLNQLDLEAELVVLAACNTALGENIQGEGPLAFPRVLLYTGADRVIASLWEVGDRTTAELMRPLYEGMLLSRRAPSEALQLAQLDLMEKGLPPRAWAAFVLLGDGRP